MKGKRNAPSKALLQEVVNKIVEVAHPQKIILFGSAARGEMDRDSDLDLLVIVRGPVLRRKIAQAIYRSMPYTGTPMDAVVVTEEDVERYHDLIGYIIRPALREGKVVYAH